MLCVCVGLHSARSDRPGPNHKRIFCVCGRSLDNTDEVPEWMNASYFCVSTFRGRLATVHSIKIGIVLTAKYRLKTQVDYRSVPHSSFTTKVGKIQTC